MRATLTLLAALAAAPVMAQDHSGHGQSPAPAKAPEMDHCAMGHLPPEQCPPKDEHAGHEGHTPTPAPTQAPTMDHSGHAGHSPALAPAMDHSGHQGHGAKTDHSGHDMSAMGADKSVPGAAPERAVPARALEGPRHAADAIWGEAAMAPSRKELAANHGAMKTGMVLIERLEARIPTEGGDTGYVWDAQGWYGGDINRFVIKTEGEGEFGGELEDAEIQALFSHAIGPFFDLQAGVRFDPEPDPTGHLVLGVQGLAPYMFHVDGALFLSDRGDLTARIEGEYDQRITQQLILQPRIEVELSAQTVAEREIGAGITKIEPGLRLRYEFVREFAPYIGIEYEAKLGETADLARAEGKDPEGFKLLVGLRAWF
jgi:copper resistance protein B